MFSPSQRTVRDSFSRTPHSVRPPASSTTPGMDRRPQGTTRGPTSPAAFSSAATCRVAPTSPLVLYRPPHPVGTWTSPTLLARVPISSRIQLLVDSDSDSERAVTQNLCALRGDTYSLSPILPTYSFGPLHDNRRPGPTLRADPSDGPSTTAAPFRPRIPFLPRLRRTRLSGWGPEESPQDKRPTLYPTYRGRR